MERYIYAILRTVRKLNERNDGRNLEKINDHMEKFKKGPIDGEI